MIALDHAHAMIAAAMKEAQSIGIKIVVSVVDDAGNLKAFAGMDEASSGSVQIGQLKARASACLPMSTRFLMNRNV